MKVLLLLAIGSCFVLGGNLRQEHHQEEASFLQTGEIVHRQSPIMVETFFDRNMAIALQKHSKTSKKEHKEHHHKHHHKKEHHQKKSFKEQGTQINFLICEVVETIHKGINKIDSIFSHEPTVQNLLQMQQFTNIVSLQEIDSQQEEIIPSQALDVGEYEDYALNNDSFNPIYSQEGDSNEMPPDVVENQYTYSNQNEVHVDEDQIQNSSNDVTPLIDQTEEVKDNLKQDEQIPLFGNDMMMPEEVEYEKQRLASQDQTVEQNINDPEIGQQEEIAVVDSAPVQQQTESSEASENMKFESSENVVTFEGHDDSLQW